jgi:hypothetical protein
MCAARVIPIEPHFVSSQNIVIGTDFAPSVKGCTITPPGTLSITFTNNSGATISIQFVPNAVYPNQIVFNDILNFQNGTNNYQTPQIANATVNYNIVAGGTTHGPYAIQVGIGPMYVSVSYVNGASQCTPGTVVIPAQGWLEMVSTDYTYNIGWTNIGDPFTPPLNSVAVGVANNVPHQASSALLEYNYTVTKYPQLAQGGSGGGTVKVKST